MKLKHPLELETHPQRGVAPPCSLSRVLGTPELGLLAQAVPPVGTRLEPAFTCPQISFWAREESCRSVFPSALSSCLGLKLPLQDFSWKPQQEQLGELWRAAAILLLPLGCSEVG